MEKKYQNHAQLVQGVSQVNDPSLSQGERLFLICLGAYSVKTYPHPGNDRLMRACGLKTRQGVNYIAQKLIRKGLIEVFAHGRGGHGMAVQYRIRTEDSRFPSPKLPASLDLQDEPASSDLHVSDVQPASSSQRTRKYDPNNPQVEGKEPASSDLHPDLNAGYKNGFKNEGAADADALLDDDDDYYHEPTNVELLDRYYDLKTKLSHSPDAITRLNNRYALGHPELWKEIQSREVQPRKR